MTTAFILLLLAPLIPIIGNFVSLIFNSIKSGFTFVFSLFSNVPNFLMDIFIPSMPPFFQTAFFGILGFMLGVLALKIICLVLIK